MKISPEKIKQTRLEHGWSQEQLSEIAGISYRTIQRIEKNGSCSLESKMALASAFAISPQELLDTRNYKIGNGGWNIGGIIGVSLCFILLTFHFYIIGEGYFFINLPGVAFVVGVTIALSFISVGVSATLKTLSLLKWLIRNPYEEEGVHKKSAILNKLIMYSYASGGVSLAIGMASIYGSSSVMFSQLPAYFAVEFLTLVYAAIQAEFIFRPLKHKINYLLLMEKKI